MNKFVIGALALTAASSLAYAGSETKEWSTLDRDLAALTQNPPGTTGFGMHGYVRSRFAHSSDIDTLGPNSDQDLSGFSMDNARIELRADQGDDYGVVIQLEAAPGVAFLLDAYGTFHITEGIEGRMGNFRAPFLWSALIEDNHLILLDRTFNGQNWSGRQEGIQINGTFDQFGWWVALQNGIDGVADEFQWTVRASFNALGTSSGNMQEGAFEAGTESSLMIGAAYSNDGTPDDGAAFAIDLGFTQGALSAHAELVDYDDDVTPDSSLNLQTGTLNPSGLATTGSETPWSITLGYMISENMYEIAARFEDLDDSDDTTAWTIGLNRYVHGHDAKWTLQFSSADSDVAAKEADTIALGLCVGV